jgi:thiol-disulfide isomerase/thioredoxin
MNKNILYILLALVVLGGGALLLKGSMSSDKEAMMAQEEKMAMEKEKMAQEEKMAMEKDKMSNETSMEKKDAMMEKDKMAMEKKDAMMAKGGYIDYDASKLAFAEKGKVVLFFKADWCPTCKALDADITKNLSSLPSDVLIMKVNYDTATDLKKQYSVLGQHTLVRVDKAGKQISAWRNSATLAELLGELK